MKLTTIAEAEAALAPMVAAAAQTAGRGITTERTLALASLVGNPQRHLRVVHVAGTSGKTSTSYYTAALLRAAGQKVGLTVSPHIASITERVQINNQPLPDDMFCAYMSEFLPQVLAGDDELPTYFEVMMAFALWAFAREGVDYAVVETGLGGLHDSSNICRRQDKLCVITDIGLDHTAVLGNSMEEIAAQKAGIIAPKNHALMHHQDEAIVATVREHVARQSGAFTVLPAPEYTEYQDRNFALAKAAYDYLAKRDGLPQLSAEALQQTRRLQVPGRLETVTRRGAQIVRDGAHNEQKMRALTTTLMVKYPGQKWAVVLAMKQSKDYEAVIALLAPITRYAVVTQFRASQDTPIESIAPGVLAQEFAKHGITATEQPTIAMAADQLIDAHEPGILVTGSLYAVGEV